MIRVGLGEMIVIYLMIMVGILALVWIGTEFSRFRKERRRRRNYVICDICDHIFEDDSGKKLLTCPRCGRLNERGRVREI
jgi:Zn finger protein HypA/HybF involved in hydrogenase expression